MQITETFLNEVGLAELPAPAKPGYIDSYRMELQQAVGLRIADELSSDQLDEFEALSGSVSEEVLVMWLEVNVPGYRTIVAVELEALKLRIREDADGILALESLVIGSGDLAEPDETDILAEEADEAATQRIILQRMHQLLAGEFGACVAPLGDDEPVLLRLPGTEYPVIIYPSSDETVTVHIIAHGHADFERPGLAAHLLAENSRLIFGRIQRMRDHVVTVEQSLFTQGLTGPQLRRVVLAVRQVAAETAANLRAIGAVIEDE